MTASVPDPVPAETAHRVVLRYTTADDGIWLWCTCGWENCLGWDPTPEQVSVAAEAHQVPQGAASPAAESPDTATVLAELVRGIDSWCLDPIALTDKLDGLHEARQFLRAAGLYSGLKASPVVADRAAPADRAVIEAAEALIDHAPLLMRDVRCIDCRDLISALAAAVRARGADPDTTTEKD